MSRAEKKILIPLDGSVKVDYTRGGSVVVDDEVIIGRFSFEAGHPECNPKGMCICIQN